MLMKVFPRLTGMGRIVMAFLVGVGAAVTIAGALIGTLIPQVMGTINAFDYERCQCAKHWLLLKQYPTARSSSLAQSLRLHIFTLVRVQKRMAPCAVWG